MKQTMIMTTILVLLCTTFTSVFTTNVFADKESITEESSEEATDESTEDSDDDDDEEEEETGTCYDGAAAIGWILCPLLDSAAGMIDWLYEDFVEPRLQIDAGMLKLKGKKSRGVRKGWKVFQTIANIIVIILLLLVILSQLTGFGIDNYGIKKILPRLIIGIVLINLSFIICALLVDTSNILGVSLKNMFNSIGVKNLSDVDLGTGSKVATTLEVGAVAVGVIAAIANAGTLLAMGPGIVIAIFLAIFSAAISILFLVFMLTARQAGVIILTMISPVAFAAYLLPNTKKFFDQWTKIFSALLVFFPLCGLLMGGADFVSRVMISTGEGFFFTLAAMLINIVPIFFIPSLLVKTMSGLGDIGAKIQSAGHNFNISAKSRINNSRRVQDIRERSRQLAENNRAQKTYKRLQKRNSRLENISAGTGRRSLRAQRRLESPTFQAKYANAIREKGKQKEVKRDDAATIMSEDTFRGVYTTDLEKMVDIFGAMSSKKDANSAAVHALYDRIISQDGADFLADKFDNYMKNMNPDLCRSIATKMRSDKDLKKTNPTLYRAAGDVINEMNNSVGQRVSGNHYARNLKNPEIYERLDSEGILDLSPKEYDNYKKLYGQPASPPQAQVEPQATPSGLESPPAAKTTESTTPPRNNKPTTNQPIPPKAIPDRKTKPIMQINGFGTFTTNDNDIYVPVPKNPQK